MTHNRPSVPWGALAILFLPLLYLGSYFALVTPTKWVHVGTTPTTSTYEIRDYRFGGKLAQTVYWPMEQVDRHFFPERWIDRAIWH